MITPNRTSFLTSNHSTQETPTKSSLILSEDIILIRGEGTYCWIYLRSGKHLLTSRTVKYWMQWFKSEGLIRVHLSFLIHRDQIDKVEVKDMHIQMYGGYKVAIARSKAKMVRQLLEVSA